MPLYQQGGSVMWRGPINYWCCIHARPEKHEKRIVFLAETWFLRITIKKEFWILLGRVIFQNPLFHQKSCLGGNIGNKNWAQNYHLGVFPGEGKSWLGHVWRPLVAHMYNINYLSGPWWGMTNSSLWHHFWQLLERLNKTFSVHMNLIIPNDYTKR